MTNLPGNDDLIAWATFATAIAALFAGVLNLVTLREMRAARLQSVRPTVVASVGFKTLKAAVNRTFGGHVVTGNLNGHDEAPHFIVENLGDRVALNLQVSWRLTRFQSVSDASQLGFATRISADSFFIPGMIAEQQKTYAMAQSVSKPHLTRSPSWKVYLPTPLSNALTLAGLAGVARSLSGTSLSTIRLDVRLTWETEAGEKMQTRKRFRLVPQRMSLQDPDAEETTNLTDWGYCEAVWVAQPVNTWFDLLRARIRG